MANQGPILSISPAWPKDLIHNFFSSENVLVEGKGLLSSCRKQDGVHAGLGKESRPYYASLYMPVPVFAILNSSGNVKFVRLRAYASFQTSNPRLPGLHTQGVCF
jgi:hypothetical protein